MIQIYRQIDIDSQIDRYIDRQKDTTATFFVLALKITSSLLWTMIVLVWIKKISQPSHHKYKIYVQYFLLNSPSFLYVSVFNTSCDIREILPKPIHILAFLFVLDVPSTPGRPLIMSFSSRTVNLASKLIDQFNLDIF